MTARLTAQDRAEMLARLEDPAWYPACPAPKVMAHSTLLYLEAAEAELIEAHEQMASVRSSLKNFEHIAGEPLSEIAAVAAQAYEFVVHARDSLGNQLAQERARPGGSYDEASYNQIAAALDEALAREAALREAAQRFCDAYPGGQSGVLGNGAARRALDEFRALLSSPASGEETT